MITIRGRGIFKREMITILLRSTGIKVIIPGNIENNFIECYKHQRDPLIQHTSVLGPWYQ